jgi:hypothetical protein
MARLAPPSFHDGSPPAGVTVDVGEADAFVAAGVLVIEDRFSGWLPHATKSDAINIGRTCFIVPVS